MKDSPRPSKAVGTATDPSARPVCPDCSETSRSAHDAGPTPAAAAPRVSDIGGLSLDGLLAEKEKLATVLDTIADEVWFADAQGRFTLANPAACREFGLRSMEALDVKALAASLEVLRPDGTPRPIAEAPPLRALAGEVVRNQEELVRTPRNGELRYRQVSANPVRDPSGRIIGSVSVVRDITERKQVEAALREADRRKDVFLAILSHELRNPLAPLQSAAALLGSPGLAPHQLEWIQSVIHRQVTHLGLLLDDLLELARAKQDKLTLKRQPVALLEVIESAVATARPLLNEHQHAFSTQLPWEPVQLNVDPLRVSQVLSNLLTNAAKYTPAHGHVVLSAAVEGADLTLRVRDDGIGIAEQHLTTIFEMFAQVDHIAHQPEGGLGIGLALVRKLVELHGGRVEAHSAGRGQGTEFVVRLPDVVITAKGAEPPMAGAGAVPGIAAAPRRFRVLVVDDNQDAAGSLSMLLELAGHDVCEAHSGLEALALAKDFGPNVAILDISMPGLDGYEVARQLRALPGGERLRLVALTGRGLDEDRERSEAEGFERHFLKPVDPLALTAWLSGSGQSPA